MNDFDELDDYYIDKQHPLRKWDMAILWGTVITCTIFWSGLLFWAGYRMGGC